ncbi:MAG TPA: HK97 family phage prohead protease, partial [Mycobacteriales bacterium]|nr:HK97 family phage prohead protease [Mycobacteriales bacterium]
MKEADLPELKTGKPSAPAVIPGRRKQRQSRTLSPGREFRRFAAHGLEVRSAADGSDSIEITGFPIMYDTPYMVCDMFGEFEETMHAGVVTNVLAAQPDVRFLFNHDGMPLARTLAGTLTLNDTATALGMTARLDARQQLANDLAVAIERGDVNQMSCGFMVGMDTWNPDYTQRDIWRLSDLFDVSAVTYPASPTTSIELALRSLMAAPVESRARLRSVWMAAREAREGKVLSAENAGLLQQALDALHEADDIDIPAIVTSLQTI